MASGPPRMAAESQLLRNKARLDASVSGHDGCRARWIIVFMAAKLTGLRWLKVAAGRASRAVGGEVLRYKLRVMLAGHHQDADVVSWRRRRPR